MATSYVSAAAQHHPRHGEVLLDVQGLVKHFPISQGVVFKRKVGAVQAVDGVNFQLRRGETLGVVGESGCGKSTLAKLLMRLETPTRGKAILEGRDIYSLGGAELRRCAATCRWSSRTRTPR